jgi:hypothetical protein
MAEDAESGADSALGGASSTLSQLMAKILGQLSLSAWLPSAALTLLVALVFRVGSVLETARPSAKGAKSLTYVTSPGVVVSNALEQLGRTSVGGIVLMIVVIVVVTMVTQAFSFESIRFLEGYWGINPVSQRLAQAGAKHWRRKRKRFEKDYVKLTRRAWKKAKVGLAADPEVDDVMLAALEARVLKTRAVKLTPEQRAILATKDWQMSAPPDLLRRRMYLDKRIGDFPHKQHVMPTLLGNVLRHFEDETGYGTVESLVQDHFHELPADMQLSHDEERSRIELYCSMEFVLMLVVIIALFRFSPNHVGYGLVSVGIGAVAAFVFYRAAVASARAYGLLVVSIATYVREHEPAEPEPAPAAPSRGLLGFLQDHAVVRVIRAERLPGR